MSARMIATISWGVPTVTAEQYDVVVYRAGVYEARVRTECPDKAHDVARRLTLGRRRSVAVVHQLHVGRLATYSGNRSEVAL